MFSTKNLHMEIYFSTMLMMELSAHACLNATALNTHWKFPLTLYRECEQIFKASSNSA